jgi:hypothetical protein
MRSVIRCSSEVRGDWDDGFLIPSEHGAIALDDPIFGSESAFMQLESDSYPN